MATLEEEREQGAELQIQLNQLKAIDSNSLVRAAELGKALSFLQGKPYFQRVLQLFRDLEQTNLDTVPYGQLHDLTQSAQEANELFSQIQEFSLKAHPQNPAEERDNLINNIRDRYDSWFSQVTPIIAYSVRKSADFKQLEQDALAQAKRVEQIGTGLQSKGQEIVDEAQGVLNQIRQTAQEVGVAQHAIQFKNEADHHKTAASKWLKTVIWLAGITALLTLANVVVYVVLIYTGKLSALTTAQTIQLAVPKVIFFSLLFSGLVWTGRVYRSHQHNFVVNQHRQNALRSFETFAKATNDDQIKSAVLLQATNCIFTPQASGYADPSAEAPGSPRILEIIRNMATKE